MLYPRYVEVEDQQGFGLSTAGETSSTVNKTQEDYDGYGGMLGITKYGSVAERVYSGVK